MNSSLPDSIIERAYERDPVIANSEFGGEFRPDLASYVDRDVIMQLVPQGLHELLPRAEHNYYAFADPAGGGGQDSFTLAISHNEDGIAVLDKIVEIRPPFSPATATAELAKVLKAYGINTVTSDRYSGTWSSEQWSMNDIICEFSEESKTEIYVNVLPAFNAGKVRLLDNKRFLAQLCSLERRTARGTGRDIVDHPVGGSDDIANSVAGTLLKSSNVLYGLELWKRADFGARMQEMRLTHPDLLVPRFFG